MLTRRSLLAGTAAAALASGGCAMRPQDPASPSGPPTLDPVRHQVVAAGAPSDVVVPAEAVGALAASRATLDAATAVVVIADAAAPDAGVAAQVATALGVPLFVAGPELEAELTRLRTRTVVAYPAGSAFGTREVVPGPSSADSLPRLDGLPARPPASGILCLTTLELSAPVSVTLAAAGVKVTPVAYPHPGSDAATAAAVRAAKAVLGAGAFGGTERFAAAVALTRAAPDLPGGGVLPFPGRRMIALYGHPQTAALGMMGEQPPAQAVQRVQRLVAEYQALLPGDTVIGAFEIITTVASGSAGDDGDYSYETPAQLILPWIEAAEAAGLYVVLDLQPGRTDFLTQAKRYEDLLRHPAVGLALDPEWRLKPNQKHLSSIGQVGVDEVNAVTAWLADLVRTHKLPPKVLTLHQFQNRMIVGRHRLDTSRDEVQHLVHVDGQGSQGAKQATWRAIREGLPARTWLGWKNFVDEDVPMLTPAQTVAQVKPTPHFVSYQ